MLFGHNAEPLSAQEIVSQLQRLYPWVISAARFNMLEVLEETRQTSPEFALLVGSLALQLKRMDLTTYALAEPKAVSVTPDGLLKLNFGSL